jgi:enediyne biosynthesis protein E5
MKVTKIKNMMKDKKAPYWELGIFFFLYFIYVLNGPHYGRSFIQAFVTFLTAIVIDLGYNYYKYKSFRFPLSTILSTFGILFLAYSSQIWPFVLMAVLSVLSKFFIKVNNNHIYNPNNFALAVCFFLFSPIVSSSIGRWDNSLVLSLIFLTFGTYIAYKVNRLTISISYIIFYILGALLLAFMGGTDPKIHLAPLGSAVFYLFTFFHITEPKTTPNSIKGMIIFGALIGVVQFIFRYNQVLFSGFYAVFIICSLRPLLPIKKPV